MQGFHTNIFQVRNKKLNYINTGDKDKYIDFVKSLKDDVKVSVYFEVITDKGSIDQIAKVHKCIREIASHTGNSFNDIKREVKEQSGVLIKVLRDEQIIDFEISFGDCSRNDLNLAIQTCIEMGDNLGLNLR
jgi:hypothetical protein